MNPRTIAIGDIHGCSAGLNALLGAIQPGPEDTIVTLGDYINRGPDSRGVIDRLIELTHHLRLMPILGHHGQMLLEARSDLHPTTWIGMGGIATLDAFGPGRDIGLIPETHFQFLESCLDFHETDNHIFVHANYFPDLAMNEQPVMILRWESLREVTPGPHNSGKTVIAGHTSQKNGEILDLGYLKIIDTYCYGGGWLTALDVQTEWICQADIQGNMRSL